MISLDNPGLERGGQQINGLQARSIWSHVLEKIVRQGGPFRGVEKTDQFDKLVDTAVRLFPHGLPDKNKKWDHPPGVVVAEYAPFLRKVYLVWGRTDIYIASNQEMFH